MMFQEFALFPHKNVAANVAFGLEMHGWAKERQAARVAEMLALVELEGFERRDISQLSGGEQQRVALARALAPGPRLLMLDEPLGALDRALRERLMLDLRQILQQVGVTAVYVTHDQTEAFAIADRVAVMNGGRIEQVAAPQALFARPATPFVARFLGFHNLLEGVVVAAGIVETEIGRVPFAGSAKAGSVATILIRPDRLQLTTNDAQLLSGDSLFSASTLYPFSAFVTGLSFRGRYTQLWLNCNGVLLMFELPHFPRCRVGEEVFFTLGEAQLLQVKG
jgi:ABC-type Fe3+/spermidine/putrescine transport system ATPase subunit